MGKSREFSRNLWSYEENVIQEIDIVLRLCKIHRDILPRYEMYTIHSRVCISRYLNNIHDHFS